MFDLVVIVRNSNFTITASATDNTQVTKVEFYINGVLKSTDSTAPYSFTTKLGGKAGETHTIMVRAYDAVNNSRAASITVKGK